MNDWTLGKNFQQMLDNNDRLAWRSTKTPRYATEMEERLADGSVTAKGGRRQRKTETSAHSLLSAVVPHTETSLCFPVYGARCH